MVVTMLKPALLYKDELTSLMIEHWYDEDYKYYFESGGAIPQLSDSCYEIHEFVSVDENHNVVGFIHYHLNPDTRSAYRFGIINFQKNNIIFGKDLRQAIKDIFFKYNANRMEYIACVDNPIVNTYRRFCEKYGGIENGYYRQNFMTIDGVLHDSISFEIMGDDFRKLYKK